jgi:hypothetical protein
MLSELHGLRIAPLARAGGTVTFTWPPVIARVLPIDGSMHASVRRTAAFEADG